MKHFRVSVHIVPRKGLLDPQGKTVLNNLKHLDLSGVSDLRIGRHVSMSLEAATEAEAKEKVETACRKLLANLIVETYHYDLKKI